MNQYEVSFVDAIKRAFTNYCVFTGRASRSEYWWFILFTILVSAVLEIPQINAILEIFHNGMESARVLMIETQNSPGILGYLNSVWNLAILLPSLGLAFRRFHDTGKSGWNILWTFFPIVGWIVILVFLCQPSQMIPNKYGAVPNVRG